MNVSKKLLATINCRKMAFVGHILRGNDITSDLLLGMVYGTRGRGRLKVRFSDNIKEISGRRSMTQLYRMAQDRRKWRATAVILNLPLDDDD